jgi:hypothetical protein
MFLHYSIGLQRKKRKPNNKIDVLEATSEGISSIAAVMATKERREIEKDKRDAEMQWQTRQLELLKSGDETPHAQTT